MTSSDKYPTDSGALESYKSGLSKLGVPQNTIIQCHGFTELRMEEIKQFRRVHPPQRTSSSSAGNKPIGVLGQEAILDRRAIAELGFRNVKTLADLAAAFSHLGIIRCTEGEIIFNNDSLKRLRKALDDLGVKVI